MFEPDFIFELAALAEDSGARLIVVAECPRAVVTRLQNEFGKTIAFARYDLTIDPDIQTMVNRGLSLCESIDAIRRARGEPALSEDMDIYWEWLKGGRTRRYCNEADHRSVSSRRLHELIIIRKAPRIFTSGALASSSRTPSSGSPPGPAAAEAEGRRSFRPPDLSRQPHPHGIHRPSARGELGPIAFNLREFLVE